ncbi:hypothetical protein [Hephaestia mangrovi]|uniref:hypothetical protein n=1 Tax=Hephaestia mangrovi TaxID=2873268 RepID=UPI001CA65DC0|nr:hypothetical protein [Hephaestia mangrovi]MBY8827928.1 hypothetical protein [Hephaestia mangrovi]
MQPPRNKVALGAIALVLVGVGIPALGQQQDKPESLLPPGFGQSAPAPAPAPSPAPSAARPAPAPAASASGQASAPTNPLNLSILPGDQATPGPSPTPTPTETPVPTYAEMPGKYELPPFARRSLDRIGVGNGRGTLPADAFGNADGRFVEGLMRRLDAPLASRWMHIFLRRALASPLASPAHVNGADFAAERAWLLLRMGESTVARAIVQQVDRQDYTPKLLQVAMQTALANGDPGQWCSLTGVADRFAPDEPAWVMAKPICAGLAGYPQQADALMKDARRHRVATGIDLHLAEKVMGAGMRGDQSVTIEWTGVTQLNAWRYGLATATGVEIPADLMKTVGNQVAYWQALSPMLDARARAVFADRAAARGVLSSAALIDLYGDIDAGDNGGTTEDGVARDLRSAYDDADQSGRLAALDKLWNAPDTEQGRYAREVMTAVAAARITPADKVAHADRLIASMLSAGFDRAAMRWEDHVASGSLAAGLLAVANPAPAGPVSYHLFDAFSDNDDSPGKIRSRMLAAGLAGLGRLSPSDSERAAKAVGVSIGTENAWTRALTRAVEARQPGMVVLLAAVGMQTPGWDGVPPQALYRIVAALNAVGLSGEARMIAAEAVARA